MRDGIYKFKILYVEFKKWLRTSCGLFHFWRKTFVVYTMKSSCRSPRSRQWVCLFSDFIAKSERTSRTLHNTVVLFNCTPFMFTVPQSTHVFWFNDHIQKESQNNTKNIRQTSLELTSLPRQKLKFHVWWSCFPYRRRNSGIVWTADGSSITTRTKGLSVNSRLNNESTAFVVTSLPFRISKGHGFRNPPRSRHKKSRKILWE